MSSKRGTKHDLNDEEKEKEEPVEKKAKPSSNHDNQEDVSTEKKDDEAPTILEKGHIYFLYRPKVDTEKVEDPNDVQRIYIVLKPSWNSTKPKRHPSLIILGRKALPDTQKHSRYWGFVAESSENMDALADTFKEHSYETKTKGDRVIEPSRPMGEGVYEIATHQGHSHLAYMLTLPDKPHAVQKAFHIKEQASMVIAVKNPTKSSLHGYQGGGLPSNEKPHYSKHLMELFKDRRFVPMDTTTEFLNHKYCELLLVGATEKVQEELDKAGKTLEKMEKEDEEHVEHVGIDKSVFDELELVKKENPIEPLKEGKWI
ncbi:hypothetical protein BDA99DRAFT_566028 [Phascolomyces articulosus]|uniref:Uncharacterized protein n=1 Tax=Phascolomyces articulosus TaxID=60185 RepID=A0AAD5K055_9FUNG|nr:hypothetical protein BDA99DRAFT_566028 [Phascolomyces articulosus]